MTPLGTYILNTKAPGGAHKVRVGALAGLCLVKILAEFVQRVKSLYQPHEMVSGIYFNEVRFR